MEIEPDSQTALADATEALPGVVAAGVPGAGGQDALFAIVLSAAAREGVERLWSTWSEQSVQVCPLLLHAESNPQSSGLLCHGNALAWDA